MLLPGLWHDPATREDDGDGRLNCGERVGVVHEPEKVGGRWEGRWGLLAEDVKDHLGGRRENPGRRGCKLGRHRCREKGRESTGLERRTQGQGGEEDREPSGVNWEYQEPRLWGLVGKSVSPDPPTSLPLPPLSFSLCAAAASGWPICHGQIRCYMISLATRTWTDPRFPRCLRPFVALRPPRTISALLPSLQLQTRRRGPATEPQLWVSDGPPRST